MVLREAAEVSESGYYAWRKRADRPATEREERRTDLSARVCEIFEAAKGRYGYRRIHAVLQRDDWVVSDRTIRVIMGEQGLVCCHPRPWRYCTEADGTPPASDLIRRVFNAEEPGVRFVGDITQIDTWAGPGYLATVIDLFNREVVGWAVADHHRAELICDAIRMAKRNKRIKRRAVLDRPGFDGDSNVWFQSSQDSCSATIMPDQRAAANRGSPAATAGLCRRSVRQWRFSPHDTAVGVDARPPEPFVGRLSGHAERSRDLCPAGTVGDRRYDRTVTCGLRIA